MSLFSLGGMSPNPFGGEERIDRINLMEFLEPNAPPDKVLFLRIIQDAASNYLYALLGKNGTCIEEFFYAHQYFFKINSNDKPTWNKNRVIRSVYIDNGMKIREKKELRDSELELMCFDKQFDLSGLSNYMHIDRFRANLKKKRYQILTNNWEQVKVYITALYQREVSEIAEGQQVPLQVWGDDLLSILVDPPTPQHLANIIYISNKLKKQKKDRHSKSNVGTYQSLADKLEKQTNTRLPKDWGPLAVFEGVDNAQTVTDDSGDNVLCDPDRYRIATSSSNGG